MTPKVSEGGCFCGKIRYRASGDATGSMVCHCETCRRITGSPAVGWLTFPKTHFDFTQGRPSEFQSSSPVRRTFCRSCGTPLTYEHSGSPSSLDVTTCSLDDPQTFPPTHHSWLSHGIGWVRFGDGLPSFQESRPGDPA